MASLDHGAHVAVQLGISRSPRWPAVEKAHLAKQPVCICCKPGENPGAAMQVHHIFPFHFCVALGRPDLELDDRNLITLCETQKNAPGANHHLLVGHLGAFSSANLSARHDAKVTFHGMKPGDIHADATWLREVAARIKPLSQMTDAEKAGFVKLMNRRLPLKHK